jgi:hypothetical protein
MIFPLKMVIFHGYVKKPDGIIIIIIIVIIIIHISLQNHPMYIYI